VVAGRVRDPELPLVTVAELGILRDIREVEGGVEVAITPTYSGCPALATIRDDLVAALREAGYAPVRVRTVLSPPWTTDWITDSGRAKLVAAGISPPGPAHPAEAASAAAGPGTVSGLGPPGASRSGASRLGASRSGTSRSGAEAGRGGGEVRRGPIPITLTVRPVACVRCGAWDTEELAAFGATACRSLWRCRVCGEPFEHVKEI
jgi:ring-1,2-phenylacetyl-CoA epoxidase subunit PaaD